MRRRKAEDVIFTEIESLKLEEASFPEEIHREGYEKRLVNVRKRMEKKNLDSLVIYGDREHYGNFKYFAGFDPRFEEGILIIHRQDPSYVFLGNECLGLYREGKILLTPVLCQALSLPNQPMDAFTSMEELFFQAGIQPGSTVGAVGWKYFDVHMKEDYMHVLCIPSYIADALRSLAGEVINATDILINPKDGLRTINDAHSIARMEYGASCASQRLKEMLAALEVGKQELELASILDTRGQVLSCHPLLASGENTVRGLISPTNRVIQLGDEFNSSMGLEGGLSCRGGYVAAGAEDLRAQAADFEEKLAKPYYAAAVSWYENIGIGVKGGALYEMINEIFPKDEYGWVLNPGHLIGTEEWLSSPVYPGSEIEFKSGMIVQMDIIPSVAGYASPNAEDGVCIADGHLQEELRVMYPDVFARMMKRRSFMTEILGMRLKEEILPMSNLAGEYRPFLLAKEKAYKIRN